MKLDMKYYLSVFWRRFPYFITIASVFTSIGLTVAVILPAEYEAKATLLVESAQIPDELAASTVRTQAQEQLQIIEQRLLTRANLLELARRLNVYSDRRAAGEAVGANNIVSDMRNRTSFTASGGRERATVLTVGFRAESGRQAAEVANEFVTLMLRENVEMRTARAGDTLQFFENEVERLNEQLDVQSQRILEFKNANADALPGGIEYLRSRQSYLQDRLTQITRETQNLREQRARLVEVFERTGQLGNASAQLTPDEQALQQARRDLDNALLVFSNTNPRVRLLESRVSQLESRVADDLGLVDSDVDAGQVLMDSQLGEIDGELEYRAEETARLSEELDQVANNISSVPANAITLEGLERDFNNTQARFQATTDRVSKAETGERLELLSKGQRITVIEQATEPTSPTKPDRPLIAVAGAGVGILAGLGFVVLLELLNRSIRRPMELTDKLGIAPLAVLPYMRTEGELAFRRTIVLAVVGLLILVIPVALFAVHTLYMPLDDVIETIVNRAGVSIFSE